MGCDMYLESKRESAENEFVYQFEKLIKVYQRKAIADPNYKIAWLNQFLVHLKVTEGKYLDKYDWISNPSRGDWAKEVPKEEKK